MVKATQLHVLSVIVFGLSASALRAVSNDRPATPGNHTFTNRFGNLDRTYTVHVPPSYDGKTSMPAVVMLHGGGGRSQGAATETGWDTKADEAGFLAVFPNATPADPTKPGHFARNPQLWNDGSERFDHGQNHVDDVGFLNAMLDSLLATFAVDAQRIYFTGFSNGASMAFRAGAELSCRIAAVAPVAGTCWVEPNNLQCPVPMCYIAGGEDPLNPLAGGLPKFGTGASPRIREKNKPPVHDSILKWALALGCPETPTRVCETNGVRTEIRSSSRDNAEVVFITVEGLGHTWAGGKSLLPELMVGKRSDKIKATDVLWEFFRRHSQAAASPHVQPHGERAQQTSSPEAAK